jgi:hypothetical protein
LILVSDSEGITEIEIMIIFESSGGGPLCRVDSERVVKEPTKNED